jgi:hypothetical protein
MQNENRIGFHSASCVEVRFALDSARFFRHSENTSYTQTKEGQTMFYQTEAKPQGWRAVAVFDDRADLLIYLGRSSTHVRQNFAQAFFEVLDDEERDRVRSISLQRWHGAADSGRWMHQTNLTIPVKAKLARTA